MALKRRSPITSGSDMSEYEGLERGEYEGRLVYVADLGLQSRSFKGEEKPPAQQIALGIEILGHPVIIDGEERPRILWTKPFNIFQELSERGNEFKYYRVFDPHAQEGQVADWEAVLGTPCNVVVGKRASRDGSREYDNIDALTPIPKKYHKDVPPAQTEPAIGDADDPDNPVNKALFGLVKYIFDQRIKDDVGDF